MIRTLILAIVLFLIGITVALNNNIKTRNDHSTSQNTRYIPIQQDSTRTYIHTYPNKNG